MNLLEAPRFPEDNFAIRFNAKQVIYLCELLYAIRKSNPELFVDENVEMMGLQFTYQTYMTQMLSGTEEQKTFASEQLSTVRDEIIKLARSMGQNREQVQA